MSMYNTHANFWINLKAKNAYHTWKITVLGNGLPIFGFIRIIAETLTVGPDGVRYCLLHRAAAEYTTLSLRRTDWSFIARHFGTFLDFGFILRGFDGITTDCPDDETRKLILPPSDIDKRSFRLKLMALVVRISARFDCVLIANVLLELVIWVAVLGQLDTKDFEPNRDVILFISITDVLQLISDIPIKYYTKLKVGSTWRE